MTFRIQARSVFLTYPQCPVPKEELLEHFKRTFNCSEITVGAELHEDGNPHLHAYLRFQKKFSSKDSKVFDYEQYHANVQAAKNPLKVKNYVKKGKDFVEFSTDETDNDDIIEVCRSMSYNEWLNHCLRSKIPYPYMKEIYSMCHLSELTTINNWTMPEGGSIIPTLDLWDPITNGSNVLVGPSGIGKTLVCIKRSIKPTLLISHMDGLRDFSPSVHKSIIFDDMTFTHLPLQVQIHILDTHQPRLLHRRYGTTLIPAGTQKFFTCNYMPFNIDFNESVQCPLRRRCAVLELYPNTLT